MHAYLEWHESRLLDGRQGFVSGGKSFFSPVALLALSESREWIEQSIARGLPYVIRDDFVRSKNVLESFHASMSSILSIATSEFQTECASQGVALNDALGAIGAAAFRFPLDDIRSPNFLMLLSCFRALYKHPIRPSTVVINCADLAPAGVDSISFKGDFEAKLSVVKQFRESLVPLDLAKMTQAARMFTLLENYSLDSHAAVDWLLHTNAQSNSVGAQLVADYERHEIFNGSSPQWVKKRKHEMSSRLKTFQSNSRLLYEPEQRFWGYM